MLIQPDKESRRFFVQNAFLYFFVIPVAVNVVVFFIADNAVKVFNGAYDFIGGVFQLIERVYQLCVDIVDFGILRLYCE